MSAIMVTGPCHGKVIDTTTYPPTLRVPFVRDKELGQLFIKYKFLLHDGIDGYYIPYGVTFEEVFATLVKRS